MVVKIEGGATRLVAASPAEQERLAATAAKFREEDLTRYLKLSLDLFGDLQTSLQPRLHLEMGLLRLVHAGRLQPIEEALASLGSPAPPAATPPKSVPPKTAPPKAAPPAASGGGIRSRLHATLIESKQTHLADAVEHSEITESGNEVVVVTPKMYQLYLKGPEFETAVRQLIGRPVKITLRVGE